MLKSIVFLPCVQVAFNICIDFSSLTNS